MLFGCQRPSKYLLLCSGEQKKLWNGMRVGNIRILKKQGTTFDVIVFAMIGSPGANIKTVFKKVIFA